MFMFDSPVQIAMVLGVVVLIFGAGKLPQLAKSLGQSKKAFKEGLREAEEADEKEMPQVTPQITSGPANGTPVIAQMSDDDLMAEMRRRVAAKPVETIK